MTENLDDAKNRVLTENTAQTIFKNLKQLENNRDRFKTRWVWELLQNACDCADSIGVNVSIKVTPDSVTFSHDGVPFTKENIAHLIYHGTTKYGNEGQIGNFGTGFLSTHLISRKVYVRGRMEDGPIFGFQLNRDAETPKELQLLNESSWGQFKESLDCIANLEDDLLTTEFRYQISNSLVYEIVQQSLVDLERNLPFVLAFNKQLKSVSFSRSDDTVEISKKAPRRLGDQLFCVPIEGTLNSKITTERSVVISENDGMLVAIPITYCGERQTISSLISTPKLFVSFPLLGTEDFAFPAVINSRNLKPVEDRDGIWLESADTNDNNNNKKEISKACDLLLVLLEYASKNNFKDAHKLMNINDIFNYDWLDGEWYSSVVKNILIARFRETPLLLNSSQEHISPSESWIPADSRSESESAIWKLASKLKEGSSKLPLQSEVDDWAQVLYSWCALIETPLENMQEALTINKLANIVSDCENIECLKNDLIDNTDIFGWLDNLYKIIFKAELTNCFDEIRILPNQKGVFKNRTELCVDCKDSVHLAAIIDEELKDIAQEFNINVREQLLHNNVRREAIIKLLNPKTESMVLNEVVEANKDEGSFEEYRDNYEQANVHLFRWIAKKRKFKYLEAFPVFTKYRKDGNEMLKLSDSVEDPILLSPIECWPETIQPYNELFPSRFIISSDYVSEDVCPEIWNDLSMKGYMHISPLYKTEQTISTFLPDEPLDDEGNMTHSSGSVMVSKIAFLSKQDVGIIDRVRKSKKRALSFIEFLVKCVLEIDVDALRISRAECECGKEHNYYQAEWLIPLKGRRWIPIGDNKNDLLSSETLAMLLASEPELIKILGQPKPAMLMKALGISLSTLSLQVLSDTEDGRLSFMQSITDIAEAAGKDVQKVRQIAQEIRDFPCILDDIEQKKKQRHVIKRNQMVGALIEDYFRKTLEAEGFKVTRTHVGSDFEIEYDYIQNNEETIFRLSRGEQSYFIEIKSTVGRQVKMSLHQARKAVEEKDHFVLFIVHLNNDELNESVIRDNGRFCFDIANPIEILLNEYDELRDFKVYTTTQEGDISLEIDPLKPSLLIGTETWENGLQFNEAIQRFIK